jgi:hypothetical protein
MSDGPDPFEFVKAFWNPLGLPLAGMVTPTLNVPEIEKRIADLKLVENWLNMNLSMLRMSIQALEMQKMTLAAMQGGTQGPAGASASNSALDAWFKMMQGGGMGAGTPPADPSETK